VIEHVARARVSVFITAETGSDKEVAARAIHHRSGRTGPFGPVNCAAIIEPLIESELFGHHKGSLTEADRRHLGLIERANGGKFFLDEISEMRSEASAKLLRVIQERECFWLGERRKFGLMFDFSRRRIKRIGRPRSRFFSNRRSKKSSRNTSGTLWNSLMETRPEHRKCWAFLVGLYTANSSAITLDTNPTAVLMGTDAVCRAMVEAA
jgi:hypothetical protein